jgi:hypothetical protein
MNLDLNIIQAMTISAAAVVPIIIAVCQVFKFWVPEKYTPFMALLVGIIITFLLADDYRGDLGGTILTGILFGLSASGLYSTVKSSAHALKAEKQQQKQQGGGNKNNC